MSQTQVLARKWRPRNFTELTGQEHVVRALTNALEQNRLHHAYLLTGTRGVGKTTIARILAKSLNCEIGITAAPCGTCPTCMQIDSGSFIDLIELDAASNTQVDNMRELLENALYAPTCGRYKIYIIDEVHMLSKSAFNAMLKTLEEPPTHVKFILATTDQQKIPITVLSRCLQFNLKQIPQPQITDHLKKILAQEKIPCDILSLQLVARAAQGSMRDALSLLDQAIAFGAGKIEEASVRDMLGIIDHSYLFDLLDALIRKNGVKLLSLADEMDAQCLSFDCALQDMAVILHRIALAQAVPQAIGEDIPEYVRINALAKILMPDDIQLFYQIALHGRGDLSLAPDEYAGFTMTLLRMLTFMPEGFAANQQPPQVPPINTQHLVKAGHKPQPIPEHTTQHVLADNPDLTWPQLTQRLKLAGMAKMLAQHSEAKILSADKIELCVPEAHKHLLEKKYQDKIQSALNTFFGKPIALDFFVGSITGLTPAAIQQRAEEEKQAEAIAAIEKDPVVQELIEQFDAKLIIPSIKPIQNKGDSNDER
ncbi:DNA polymerase III subunit gamma/tau [Nitrosomonas ureae]|uniref:DNA polymerase III subunit gamma/tau n=1 Tax=Nitrosomonas ureae TaxID=44577 RepID=A0A1H2H5G9_9PROT|nr:DNA polymerase III subunit gamma/tau [Nitrosomonas ureae]ALQ51659.1 DNA polymerase III subunit gamma/tau [Nitrosomonas ureae]SDU27055.1 DNA polymerase-3 subunit gamma/tau [Nitrosomonas ureae]